MPPESPEPLQPLGMTVHSLPATPQRAPGRTGRGRLQMLLILLACKSPDPLQEAETEWIGDITVQTSAMIPAVLTVGFSTPRDATAWVEFGVADSTERLTPASAGTDHTHHLLGLPPLTDAQLQIVVEIDEGVRLVGGWRGGDLSILALDLPVRAEVEGHNDDFAFLYFRPEDEASDIAHSDTAE